VIRHCFVLCVIFVSLLLCYRVGGRQSAVFVQCNLTGLEWNVRRKVKYLVIDGAPIMDCCLSVCRVLASDWSVENHRKLTFEAYRFLIQVWLASSHAILRSWGQGREKIEWCGAVNESKLCTALSLRPCCTILLLLQFLLHLQVFRCQVTQTCAVCMS